MADILVFIGDPKHREVILHDDLDPTMFHIVSTAASEAVDWSRYDKSKSSIRPR
jgi:hypothetical protein